MLQISPESNRPTGSGLPPSPPYLMEFTSVGTSEDESALLWRGENGWVIALDPENRIVCYLAGKSSIRMDEQVSPGQLSRLSNTGLSSNQPEADREKMQQLLAEVMGPSAIAASSDSTGAPWWTLIVGALLGIVLTVLVCLPFMLSKGNAAPAETIAENEQTEPEPDEVDPPKEAEPNGTPTDEPSEPKTETIPEISRAPKVEPTPIPEKPDPEDGVYIVVLREDGEEYHLGTAWAKGPQELVSSGTLVKMLIESMREDDAKVLVIHAQSFKEYEVRSGSVPPTLDRLDKEAMNVGQKLEQVQREMDFLRGKRAAGDDVESELKPLEKEFEALGSELAGLMTQIGEYDVGTLRVSERLPVTLETADQVSSAMDVTIAGVPLSLNSMNQSGSIGDLRLVTATGQTVTRPRNGVFKLTFDARLNSERIWRGSPVLNADGKVIGTYSTPLLLEADDNKDLPHSIVGVSKIR
ncbi:hypothetical protein [Thalassoroseus pseudoceratinae]|uniref:hypothetical protein n=1 Tax=Thalassoroseus pseudoceratinae TaxID=2713176 RepID=UPI001421F447|nr:hypothetical protein [Thalassoroseus pseudoceratinae]